MVAGPILKMAYPVLMLALALPGDFVTADAWKLPWLDPYLLEDGGKPIGISGWSACFFYASGSPVRERLRAVGR